ncbi:MAG: ubiquinol-cytochrome c reductase iron-sulfur subunit [Anaerolineales bacterium]|jgi:menaquinol-cytochrome c reductase iron-sulfur subunit|nr:ubiquinol-cytochrome c reductase iron-sulfur subunit [Anaerolineales bacterium]HUV25900.1 ubiquinol-cytochrome c reductase iron-sulfur subunit [Anaerolineales bacterium]
MEEEKDQLSRRNFLAIAIGAIGALMGIVMAIPAVAYVIGPALKRKTSENWVRLGPTSKVELGTPTLFKTTVETQTGWILTEEELSVYVLTEDGRDYIALSNICTHLGCRVRWISDQGQYFCPCHNAAFNKIGLVVSGPPPKPLDRFETKVEDEQLFILLGG